MLFFFALPVSIAYESKPCSEFWFLSFLFSIPQLKTMSNLFQNLARRGFSNAYLLLSITALCWAGNFIVGRGIYEEVPPVALATIRWSGAFLIALPFTWKHLKKDWPTLKKHWLIMVTLGAIGIGSFNTLVYTGVNYTTAINGVIMNSVSPVFIAVMAFFLFKERLSPVQTFGILLSIIGVLIVISRGNINFLGNLTFNIGDLYVLAAFIVWAIYTVMLRLRPAIHNLSFLAATFLLAAVANIPFLFLEMMWSGRYVHLSPQSTAGLLYVMVFPSIIAYLFYNRGVELIGANRGGAFLHLVPLFGAVLAVTFLGEELQTFHIAGFLTILCGVAMTTKKPAVARNS